MPLLQFGAPKRQKTVLLERIAKKPKETELLDCLTAFERCRRGFLDVTVSMVLFVCICRGLKTLFIGCVFMLLLACGGYDFMVRGRCFIHVHANDVTMVGGGGGGLGMMRGMFVS